jgi:hypothetical protein
MRHVAQALLPTLVDFVGELRSACAGKSPGAAG